MNIYVEPVAIGSIIRKYNIRHNVLIKAYIIMKNSPGCDDIPSGASPALGKIFL
jgi:hypothetical protein